MNEIIGVMDGLVGLAILVAMLFNRSICHCPMTHKIGLWMIAMGMMYQAIRHLCPEQFSDNVLMAFIHVGLWIALFFLGSLILKHAKATAQ